MRQKSGPEKQPAEDAIRDIRRATRRHFSAEEKIRVVLEGYRGHLNLSFGNSFDCTKICESRMESMGRDSTSTFFSQRSLGRHSIGCEVRKSNLNFF